MLLSLCLQHVPQEGVRQTEAAGCILVIFAHEESNSFSGSEPVAGKIGNPMAETNSLCTQSWAVVYPEIKLPQGELLLPKQFS